MSHYFEFDSSIASKKKNINVKVCDIDITLITDKGVFSKDELDEGSKILLETLIPLKLSGNILDLGCGYGPIGICLALSNNENHLTLADINPRATLLARENAKSLGLENRVTVIDSNIYDSINDKFNFIALNPPIRAGKAVTYKMYLESKQHLIDGGCLFFVIRKAQGAKSASNYVKEVFGNVTLIARNKGYHIYKAVRKIDEKEPL